MLIEKDHSVLSMAVESRLDEVSQIDGIRFMPVNGKIAIKSTALPGEFHKDPAGLATFPDKVWRNLLFNQSASLQA